MKQLQKTLRRDVLNMRLFQENVKMGLYFQKQSEAAKSQAGESGYVLSPMWP